MQGDVRETFDDTFGVAPVGDLRKSEDVRVGAQHSALGHTDVRDRSGIIFENASIGDRHDLGGP